MAKRKKDAGFTLIEVLFIVAIIIILVSVVFANINQSRVNARVNAAKTSLRTTLPAVLACNDSSSAVNVPVGTEDGSKLICNNITTSAWPKLSNGYQYFAGGFYGANCDFYITTGTDTPSGSLHCTCLSQICT
ncbi:MAG: type II secretion system protein [Candidatus Moranbacteria bacterium]|nr:type II secretion system protein [Candidatus Moranbacteria bacterium]